MKIVELPLQEESLISGYSLREIHKLAIVEKEQEEEIHSLREDAWQDQKHGSKDMVRVYLQEIGRVALLEREEEITYARQIQKYISLLEILHQSPQLASLVKLMEVHDRLVSQLSHRPSLQQWATNAHMKVGELREALAEGRKEWAALAAIDVATLQTLQKQGTRAKYNMIQANLRLVVSVAKKYQNRGLELLDLIQEGTMGLEKAVDKFDPTKGYRFSTYAYWWIRQGITRAIATQSRAIRLPVHITEKLNRIKKAQRKISQEKGRSATLEELAKEIDSTPSQVREVLLKIPRSISLEVKVGKQRDTELGELLETEYESPETLVIKESLQSDIETMMANLTPRERDVIELRYGLKDGQSHSLADIGRVLELSRERVRQIETRAMQKLRQPKHRNHVEDYLDTF